MIIDVPGKLVASIRSVCAVTDIFKDRLFRKMFGA